MNTLWALALGWAKENWHLLAWAAGGALISGFVVSGCHGEVVQASSSLVRAQLLQIDELKGKLATAGKAKAKVVYVSVPGQPCPDVHVEVEAESSGLAEAVRASQVSITAEAETVVPAVVQNVREWYLWTGAGFDLAPEGIQDIGGQMETLRAKASLGVQWNYLMLDYSYRFDGWHGPSFKTRF